MGNISFISVVIPTYNRINLLMNCLTSFENLNYPREFFEVIVVDDGSTDRSYENLKEITEQFTYKVRVIHQSNGGPARARNNGIRNARGEFIAFTDDDCEVDRNWLRKIIKGFTSEDIAGVGGMVISKNDDTLSQYMDYYRILQPPSEGDGVKYLVTANACYRRKVLLEVDGFSEEIKNPGGEDPDLSYKIKTLGHRLVYNLHAKVYHNHKQDLKSFYRTFYNYGRGVAYLNNKWGEKAGGNSPSNVPVILHAFNILPLIGQILSLRRRGVGVRLSILFASLNLIARFAHASGIKRGY